jgi:CRP/FNR family transcriptional regulator, cyclic AMP receptor protein
MTAMPSAETLFAKRGWLAAQPASLRKAVIDLGHRRRFDRGEFLHYEGDGPGGVYGILTGGLGVMLARRDGTSGLSTIVRPGTWIGEAPLQSGGERVVTLRATEPSEVLCVELRDLDQLAGEEPDVRRRYGWMLLFSTQHTLQAMSDLQLPESGRRLAATLLRVTAVTEGVQPDHPDGFLISQSELGEMANVSRSRANRVLAEFARQGWVRVRYNRIRIDDPASIERYIAAGGS